MKEAPLIICLLLVPYFAICQKFKEQNRTVRNDGFYFYDNGLDTLIVDPGTAEIQLQLVKFMQNEGTLPRNKQLTHYDSVGVSSIGSTHIDCIAFFNGTSGTTEGTGYRNDTFINHFLSTVNRRKAINADDDNVANDDDKATRKNDRMNLISDIHFINDSVFTFLIGKGYATVGKQFNSLEQKYRCTVRRDSLNVKISIGGDPGYMFAEGDYHFIPFNKIPIDLLKPRSKK